MCHTYKILAPGSSSMSRPYLRRDISLRTIQYIWRLPLAKPPSQHIVNVRYVQYVYARFFILVAESQCVVGAQNITIG